MAAQLPTLDEIRAAVTDAVRPLREQLDRLVQRDAERGVTVAEAATRLGVSERTVQRRIADGTLASVRIGGVRRVLVDDLLRSDRGGTLDVAADVGRD
jgi:excisionase family DNA binding protein